MPITHVEVPPHVDTHYDKKLIDFMIDHHNNGVIIDHGKYKEPPQVTTFWKEHGLPDPEVHAGGAAVAATSAPAAATGAPAAASAPLGIKPVSVNVGPFEFKGRIDGLGIDAEVGTKVPIFGYKKLVEIKGNLRTGIQEGFDVFGLASGSVRLYLDGKNVMITLSATLFKHKHEYTFKLFTI